MRERFSPPPSVEVGQPDPEGTVLEPREISKRESAHGETIRLYQYRLGRKLVRAFCIGEPTTRSELVEDADPRKYHISFDFASNETILGSEATLLYSTGKANELMRGIDFVKGLYDSVKDNGSAADLGDIIVAPNTFYSQMDYGHNAITSLAQYIEQNPETPVLFVDYVALYGDYEKANEYTKDLIDAVSLEGEEVLADQPHYIAYKMEYGYPHQHVMQPLLEEQGYIDIYVPGSNGRGDYTLWIKGMNGALQPEFG